MTFARPHAVGSRPPQPDQHPIDVRSQRGSPPQYVEPLLFDETADEQRNGRCRASRNCSRDLAFSAALLAGRKSPVSTPLKIIHGGRR